MHFAEFLNEGFPAHLRILSAPTCVGFGTGACNLVRSFSRQRGPLEFDFPEGLSIYRFSALQGGFASTTSYEHKRKSNNPLRLSYCVTPSIKHFMVVQEYQPAVHRLRIFRLGLGPDLPWDDERCPGNLRLSVDKILTCLFATHTNILTS